MLKLDEEYWIDNLYQAKKLVIHFAKIQQLTIGFRMIIKVRLKSFFLNQCRKEADPTYNNSEIEWWISRSTQNRLKIQIHARYMSDPILSDIDFKMKWIGSEPELQTNIFLLKIFIRWFVFVEKKILISLNSLIWKTKSTNKYWFENSSTNSTNQRIKFSLICKNVDKFSTKISIVQPNFQKIMIDQFGALVWTMNMVLNLNVSYVFRIQLSR